MKDEYKLLETLWAGLWLLALMVVVAMFLLYVCLILVLLVNASFGIQ